MRTRPRLDKRTFLAALQVMVVVAKKITEDVEHDGADSKAKACLPQDTSKEDLDEGFVEVLVLALHLGEPPLETRRASARNSSTRLTNCLAVRDCVQKIPKSPSLLPFGSGSRSAVQRTL